MKRLNQLYQFLFGTRQAIGIQRGRMRTADSPAVMYGEVQYSILPGPGSFGQAINVVRLVSSTSGLVAFAGGGQTNATQITTPWARFDTVATGGDSSKLPPAAVGLGIFVVNAGAAAMNMFPSGATDIINALAPATAFSVPAGKTCEFFCMAAGKWSTQLSA